MGSQIRDRWGTRIGFVLAAAGSAVGLGNVWKFPYIAGVHGGGGFVFVYLLCILLAGLPILLAEFIIGKSTARNPVGAFKSLEGERSHWLIPGFLSVLAAFMILSYYSVIGGWVVDYSLKAITGEFSAGKDPEEIISLLDRLMASGLRQVLLHLAFIFMTTCIVMRGVRSGIERASNVLMPALFLILLSLFLFSLTQPGNREAFRFLFHPSPSLLTPQGILEGLGHAFFTLSLGMGAMITYGSYMRADQRLMRSAVTVAILDTLISMIAGVVIFSIVFTFGLEPDEGPTLVFSTLPALFARLPGGGFISSAFFILLAFAALTSAISLLEVVVAFFVDTYSWSRTRVAALAGLLIFLAGLLSAFSFNLLKEFLLPVGLLFGKELTFFETIDKLASNLLLPLGGLFVSIYVGWKMNRLTLRGQFENWEGRFLRFLFFLLRYVAPTLVGAVFLYGFAFTHSLIRRLG
jgi:NSS family neurotransmitter:Na+ symporter